jgi:hypothetical protein
MAAKPPKLPRPASSPPVQGGPKPKPAAPANTPTPPRVGWYLPPGKPTDPASQTPPR